MYINLPKNSRVKQRKTKHNTKSTPKKHSFHQNNPRILVIDFVTFFGEKPQSFEVIPLKGHPFNLQGWNIPSMSVSQKHPQFQKKMTVFNHKNSTKSTPTAKVSVPKFCSFFITFCHPKLHVLADGNTWKNLQVVRPWQCCEVHRLDVARVEHMTWHGWVITYPLVN